MNGYVEDDEPVLEGNISVPGTAGEPNGAGLFKGSRSRECVPGGMGSSVGGPREELILLFEILLNKTSELYNR